MAGNGPSPFGNPPPGYDDGGTVAPAVAPAPAPPVIEAPMTNPEAAKAMGLEFLAKHEASMANRTKEVDNVFSKQQLTVDTMSKLLDDTTASLKRSREGRSNLPLMALGAGMLSGTGDFGSQLGAGIKQMVPAIQKDRSDEEDYQYKLATMAMKRAGIEQAPLQDKLAYLRALQVGDESTIRAIESGLIKTVGQTDKVGQKAADNAAALEEKANNHAMERALAQIKVMGEGHFATPEARQAALLSFYEGTARSLKVPEESIKKFVEQNRAIFDSAPKGGFKVPGDKPEDIDKAKSLGLPPKPTGYTYDGLTSPTDAMAAYKIERANYEKETKDNQVEQDKNLAELRGIERATEIMKKYPGITGRTAGVFPHARYPQAAHDEIEAIFTKNQIHGVPQGQGAISNFERELFEKAVPRIGGLEDANRNLLAVRSQILKDQIEKRKFINTYFSHYKTTMGADDAWAEYARSDEGRAGFTDNGMVVPNPARISWQEYMKKKHGDAAPAHAEGGQYKGGGAVHLGPEWD